MTVINMTQTCKENGITSFSRTRGGWMKIVEGYDKSKHGGYRFVGSNFIKVGNYDVDISNGLYLDCSKPVIDGEKTEIMNLFKIHDGEVELLKTVPKSKRGWAYDFEDAVEEYFANDEATPLDVMNAIREVTSNRDVLHKVAMEILQEEQGKIWLNELQFQSHMAEADVYKAKFCLRHSKVEEMMEKLNSDIHLHHEAIRYFDFEINDEYERNCLYSFIHAHPSMKNYTDFELTFKTIKEDYYIDLANVKKLREFNRNTLTESEGKALNDNGFYFTFKHDRWSNYMNVYIVVPNVIEERILIQKMELQLL